VTCGDRLERDEQQTEQCFGARYATVTKTSLIDPGSRRGMTPLAVWPLIREIDFIPADLLQPSLSTLFGRLSSTRTSGRAYCHACSAIASPSKFN
jgi:hypothetical protein